MRFRVLTATKIEITFLFGCYDEDFGGYTSRFRKTREEGGNKFLRNVVNYQPAQSYIVQTRWTQLLYKDSPDGILSVRRQSNGFKSITL